MTKPIVKNLVQLLTGQVQDDTCTTHQELVNKVFGIAEQTAEVPNIDDYGQVNGLTSIVAHRGIIGESKGDFDAIGPEAFGRELMGRDFYGQVETAPGGRYVLDANQGVDGPQEADRRSGAG